jgi:hypothetical protein
VLSCLPVVVFRSLRCCLSFGLRRLVSMVLVFLSFCLCLMLVVLLCRLPPRLSRNLQCRRYPLLRVRARFSTVVRVVILLATAPTATRMATLGPPVIRGIPVCVHSPRLMCSLALQDLLLLPSLIRTLSGVFVVCSLLQALLRWALLVL